MNVYVIEDTPLRLELRDDGNHIIASLAIPGGDLPRLADKLQAIVRRHEVRARRKSS